jgi:hypothetical protein
MPGTAKPAGPNTGRLHASGPFQWVTFRRGRPGYCNRCDDIETFELGREEEAALLAAIAEVNRGEIVDGFELVAKLAK